MTRFVAFGLLLVLAFGTSAAAQPMAADPFASPNLLVTRDRLDAVQAAVAAGDPLMIAARQQVLDQAQGFLARDPDPIVGPLKVPGFYTKEKETQRAIARRLRGDAWGAYCLALAGALTGEERYLAAAERYLFAWVDSLTRPERWGKGLINRAGDTAIVSSYSLPNFCFAYDLLRGQGRIDAAEEARFSTWLRRFVEFHDHRALFRNNHDTWRVLFRLCAAHVLGDAGLFARSLDDYRATFRAQVGRKGAMWRELVRGKKAATYTLMNLEAMVQIVHIAEGHGVNDLRDLKPRGATLRDAILRLVSFVEDPKSWSRHRWLTWNKRLNGPAHPAEWGYVFEVPAAWWGDARYSPLIAGAPYGLTPPRSYTLGFATLLFRPIQPRTPAGGAAATLSGSTPGSP